MGKFKNSKGKEVVVSNNKSKFVEGELQYFDNKWKRLVDEDGIPLELIPNKEIPELAVFTDTKSRFANNAKYFKKRARKHSQSSDQQELKRLRTQEELGGAIGRRDLKLRKRKT